MSYLMQSGPLVWLVLIVGVLGLVWAVRFALRQHGRDASMAIAASIGAGIVALLSTVAGFQRSVGGLREVAADDRWIYLWGLKESLNSVVIALIMAFLVTILLMIGTYRRSTLDTA